MNRNEALSQSSLLQDMIRVKKLRFKDLEERKLKPHITKEYLKRRANFEEFKAVYGDCGGSTRGGGGGGGGGGSTAKQDLHKTKSGSLCKVPRVNGRPEHVETVNIELPLHYGGDRAVQIIENKIKPKRASSHLPKVHREVTTETQEKPKKSVKIVETLKTIEEKLENESETVISDKQLKEIEKHLSMRKERCQKNLPKPPIPKLSKKRTGSNGKLMSTLSSINEKLKIMQDKYFKIQYKTVNDCFTQSGNVEVFFENKHFENEHLNIEQPTEVWEESKTRQDDLFPEFPQIEDTLKQIENHLEDIAKEEEEEDEVEKDGEGDEFGGMWRGDGLEKMLDEQDPIEDTLTKEILKTQNKLKTQKLKTISHQIDHVENFYEKIASIVNDESSIASVDLGPQQEKTNPKSTHIEGPDLESSIKKSNYLSRDLERYDDSTVKIFSDNKRSFWRDRLREIREQKEYSVESVTKMIDALKVTLEESIYEPVT
ncbi:uncharacterized protein LOC126741109 [Anthonomus grandis grandis]|uniref:uncharacterized protein LOC126741109 n=1 Tax=Anthonomus grandis grandis TaxID=2921223 RepID=UPI002165DA6F|nr:uncharacterized protein LOC126741109 [Anthonomus grandis grandis]